MRILASNPDTIGDLILRQPMYRAWQEAGHELMLVVRPGVTPVVPYVAPDARVVELPYEAYAADVAQHWDRFAPLFDAARAFEPDALVVAPYRWTAFDERLAAELPPGVRRVGMNGHLYRGDPSDGDAPESAIRFDDVAIVCEDAPEIEKNATLAATVLGTTPAPGGATDPRIEPTYDDLLAAARTLSDLKLAAGEYWVACVTGTAHVTLKTWHGDHWAQVLSKWAAERGRKFLFVGLPEEEAAARAVVDSMGPAAVEHARVWSGDGRTFGELVGLTALSSGYAGHDTGPMHVAAALRKPVLAVFGGGTWPRFRPAVTPSVAVTVGVSCRGCQWVCSFAQSHCIKAVPVDEVSRAADDLEAGRVSGREARVLAPSAELQAQMVREAAAIARERMRAAGEASRELRGTQERWERDVADLRDQIEAQQRHAAAQEGAVERAHAELGSQLREKESMIRRQDEQLREKETALHEQHELLQRQNDTLHRTSDEAAHLRDHAAAAERQRAGLAEELAARAAELARLQADLDAKSREAAELASSVALHEGEIDRLQQDLKQVEQANRATTEARKQQGYEIGRLREQVQRLDERLRAVEPYVRYRRPLRQILVDLVIGPQHYYPPPPKNLPGITVVTVTQNSEARIRETVESVLGQDHPHVQFVVVDRGSSDNTLAIIDEYKDRFEKLAVVTEAAGGFFDAVAKGYSLAAYDAVGRLDPGDVYEPGALFRVAEYFRDNRGARAVVFEETVRQDGWRLPAPPRRAPDVYQLLRAPHDPVDGVFVTTNAYQAIDGFNRERGAAAQWDLWLRLSRRFGIHRAAGHVRSITGVDHATAHGAGDADERSRPADFDNARKLFLASFGWLGRARCTLIHWFNRLGDSLGGARQSRLSFPAVADDKPLPAGAAPAHVPGQPICPLNGRLPDRLLFSSRDTLGGDDAVNYVYYDSAADAALVYPPLELEKLQALYESDGSRASAIVPPDASHASPYAGYRGPGGRLGHLLSRVRSPWWWFARPDFGDPSLGELLESLDGHVPQRGVSVRFLNVACYDGAVLDALKAQTDWTLFGTETNPRAAAAARAKGHVVWETSAEDAAFKLPIGQAFDVIYLGRLTEHLPDPLLVVRRLRQLLAPGGRIVLDTPNLDSKLLDVFGPTWSHWQPPYHRTLLGRRGLGTLARLAAFRVERLRTRTHPLPAVRSAQLHALGLGAVVPDTATFPPDVASRGVLLAGWARLLWDWRGRGDYMYAVLRAE